MKQLQKRTRRDKHTAQRSLVVHVTGIIHPYQHKALAHSDTIIALTALGKSRYGITKPLRHRPTRLPVTAAATPVTYKEKK